MQCMVCNERLRCHDEVTEYFSRVCHLSCVCVMCERHCGTWNCKSHAVNEKSSYEFCWFELLLRHGDIFNSWVPRREFVYMIKRAKIVNKRTEPWGGLFEHPGLKLPLVDGKLQVPPLSESAFEFRKKYREKVDDFCRQLRELCKLNEEWG